MTLRQIHRFPSFVLVLTFAVTVGSKADDQLLHLRKGYEDCVYRSVHLQGTGGTWEAFELAFLTCQGKEQAITEHLAALGMAPATIDKALQAFKLRLRKTVR